MPGLVTCLAAQQMPAAPPSSGGDQRRGRGGCRHKTTPGKNPLYPYYRRQRQGEDWSSRDQDSPCFIRRHLPQTCTVPVALTCRVKTEPAALEALAGACSYPAGPLFSAQALQGRRLHGLPAVTTGCASDPPAQPRSSLPGTEGNS